MADDTRERHRLVERILLNVHLVGKGLRRHAHAKDRDNLPVHGPQLGVLWMTGKKPGLTVSDLARRFMVAKSNVSEMVDRLYREGLLEKRADEADQRLVRLHVTEKGQALLQAAWAQHLATAREALAGLSDGQLATVAENLELLANALNKNNPGGGDD